MLDLAPCPKCKRDVCEDNVVYCEDDCCCCGSPRFLECPCGLDFWFDLDSEKEWWEQWNS